MTDEELKQQFSSLVDLITSTKESLEREITSTVEREITSTMEREIRPVKDALERIEARLSRQGGLIQGGARQVSRLIVWSEDIDHLQTERDARLEDLTRRLERLEHPEGK